MFSTEKRIIILLITFFSAIYFIIATRVCQLNFYFVKNKLLLCLQFKENGMRFIGNYTNYALSRFTL